LTGDRATRTISSCPARFVLREREDATKQEFSELGISIYELDALEITTKRDLLEAMAKDMSFPSYFGMNQDALIDCLRDLSWLPIGGHALLVHDSDRFWKTYPDLAGMLLECWLSCVSYWEKVGVPFQLVFLWSDTK